MQRTQKKYDWLTIGLYLAIVLFGWFNIYAAVYDEAHTALFDFSCQHGKQIIWMGIAFIVALVIVVMEPRVFSNGAYIIYAFTMLLLVAVLFLGESTHGGQSWFNFGPFKFQPSEFAKFATALALSKLMSGIGVEIRNFRTKVAAFALMLAPAALILLQHDTGSALVFASFLFPMFREGLSGTILVLGILAVVLFVMTLLINKYLFIGIIAAICLAYLFVWLNKRTSKNIWRTVIFFACCCAFIMSVDFAFNRVLESHQQERINVLLGKSDDIKGAGYNQHQSKIAIGSGEFIGKGWCKGVITKGFFVPEQETDFIFCTVGEEWGFVGSALLIIAYLGLLQRLVTMAERQRSTFARFYGYSVASIIFMHEFINIGMVLGLLPVIGIPLPFFSYGGSSLLAFTILLFIFIRQDADRNMLL